MEHPPRNLDLTCFNWVKLILKTDLNYNAKYLALYLSTYMNLNQDMAFPSLKRIETETSLSHPTVLKYLKILESEGWIIKQSGSRVESNRYWINIPKRVINEVGNVATYVTSEEKVGNVATSNNNRITSNNNKRFTKPTIEQVSDYCLERANGINPQAFIDHYEANGWVQGKGKPIKDWKAAVRTWENNRNGQNRPRPENTRGLSAVERVRRKAAQREAERQGAIIPTMGGDG